ncbi:MAG: hypothetical protein CMM54_02395 [Rhodospirillaceae bacterium]|nr:hypothetical protein [Rhodospirillaceae bacterium]|tara:strand:+ start:5594 stop:8680 length:3087 start_codon:yes stop_codon:yes gene_type:complete
MTALHSYWPTEGEISRCIKTEAESMSDAALLSVHQETPLSIRNAGSSSKRATTEDELLDSFLTTDLPEGTLLLVITGASGAGKSHMIRWLAAHLERDPRAEKMHVIRVPKSASLKSVVELILEPLSGDERFAQARSELEDAVSSVNPEDGAIHFLANLQIALREEARILKAKLGGEPNHPDIRALKSKLNHAQNLPNYFNDSALTQYFQRDVMPRIVERAIRGKDEAQDEQFPQFKVADLKLPDDVDLGGAGQSVKRYYQTILNRGQDDDGYKVAAEVLNSVIDKAIRNLFRLNQAMGGVTLEEIVLRIRDLLLEEGKELVLLIEDFAALSGIQEVLLSVCIQEAVRDGQTVRSPMRTALAVTDGYELTSRDTINTRAKREWVVESILPSEEDVLKRTECLVAAYLNAARWGEMELLRKFEQSRNDGTMGLTNWVEVYRDEIESEEESKLLEAFGSVNDVPLFPYNKHAIGKLADDFLRKGGDLQFNPRTVINHVIRDPLNRHRINFENEAFPPSNFSDHPAKASLASWISSKNLGQEIEGRLRQTIIYWGGNPDMPENLASINSGIFKTFSLPTPEELDIGAPPGPVDPPPDIPIPPVIIAPPENNAFIEGWQERLEKWVTGERLPQRYANDLRKSIISALNSAVDWNAACIKPVIANQNIIELPHAAGNRPSNEKNLVIAKSTRDDDGQLRRTMLAFLRCDNQGSTLDYPEAAEDTALIANTLDRLVPEYLDGIAKEASKDASILATALVRQGRVLGVVPKKVAGRPSIVEAVFSPAPEFVSSTHPPDSPEKRWLDLKTEAASVRKALQDLLATKIGAFQGTGSTVYAIDIARLKLIEEETLPPLKELDPDQRAHFRNITKNQLQSRSNSIARNLSDLNTLIRSALGEEFDKQVIVNEVRQLIDLAEEAGVWPPQFPHQKQALLNRLDEFRDSPVSDALDKLEHITTAVSIENLDDVIYALGKIDIDETHRINKFIELLNLFMKELGAEINSREQADQGMSIADLVAKNQTVLDELKSIFASSNGS